MNYGAGKKYPHHAILKKVQEFLHGKDRLPVSVEVPRFASAVHLCERPPACSILEDRAVRYVAGWMEISRFRGRIGCSRQGGAIMAFFY